MPSLPLRSALSGTNSSDVGVLTHALIACHAPLREDDTFPVDLLDRLFAFSEAMLDANPNRRRVVCAEASGHAFRYLTRLAPTAPWTLLGVEYDTEGGGRVDVAWFNTTNGQVMYDELKTSRVASQKMPTTWVPQARRYAVAGQAQFGDRFVGTRLLPINVMRLARLVPPVGASQRLRPTPAQPLCPVTAGER